MIVNFLSLKEKKPNHIIFSFDSPVLRDRDSKFDIIIHADRS